MVPVGVEVSPGLVSMSRFGLRQPASKDAARTAVNASIIYFFIISSLKIVYKASITRNSCVTLPIFAIYDGALRCENIGKKLDLSIEFFQTFLYNTFVKNKEKESSLL